MRHSAVEVLCIGKMAAFKARIDQHLVNAVLKRRELSVGHAESPLLCVVGRPVGNEIRLLWKCEHVLLQLLERHLLMHRDAVVQDVQIRTPKIHDTLARWALYVGVANVPFTRHDPIEHLCPSRYLVQLEVDVATQQAQGLPHAITGDATRDGKYF